MFIPLRLCIKISCMLFSIDGTFHIYFSSHIGASGVKYRGFWGFLYRGFCIWDFQGGGAVFWIRKIVSKARLSNFIFAHHTIRSIRNKISKHIFQVKTHIGIQSDGCFGSVTSKVRSAIGGELTLGSKAPSEIVGRQKWIELKRSAGNHSRPPVFLFCGIKSKNSKGNKEITLES